MASPWEDFVPGDLSFALHYISFIAEVEQKSYYGNFHITALIKCDSPQRKTDYDIVDVIVNFTRSFHDVEWNSAVISPRFEYRYAVGGFGAGSMELDEIPNVKDRSWKDTLNTFFPPTPPKLPYTVVITTLATKVTCGTFEFYASFSTKLGTIIQTGKSAPIVELTKEQENEILTEAAEKIGIPLNHIVLWKI